jgi:hypothetical protein
MGFPHSESGRAAKAHIFNAYIELTLLQERQRYCPPCVMKPRSMRIERTARAFCSGVDETVSSTISACRSDWYGSSMPVIFFISPRRAFAYTPLISRLIRSTRPAVASQAGLNQARVSSGLKRAIKFRRKILLTGIRQRHYSSRVINSPR